MNLTVKGVKKNKIAIVVICIAIVIALIIVIPWYITFKRTIFDNRAEPTDAEFEKIHEITAFKKAKLSGYIELISRYYDMIKVLGIEIRSELNPSRAVNKQGLVEAHDWNKDLRLPGFYYRGIICISGN